MRAVTMRLATSALVVAATVGCRSAYLGPAPEVAPDIRLAVMPFAIDGDLDDAGAFRRIATDAPMPEELPEHAASQLTAELTALDVSAIDVETVRRAAPPAGAAIYDLDLAVRVGRAVGARYVVMGAISRYVERVGTALGVESPASVAYRVLLVDVAGEVSAGSYRLDYTQSPLSDDLKQLPTWLQGKFGWMTRQEILDGSFKNTARQIARTVANVNAS